MTNLSTNSCIGEYRIVDFLGAGGMGEVYRAVHSKIDRVVAIKILTQPGHDSDFLKRFLNEARIQARLNHQHIATLYDFLENQGRPCIIMEYVDGETLSERIARHGALSLAEAIAIYQPVVEAIAYIHKNGVIHRDIKSNNIKIDSSGRVKLLDFGIARGQSSPKLTATGSVVGTMQYLSPEQLKGEHANARSDIWALGVLFYEMLIGRVPFEGTNALHLCDKISKVVYTPPTIINPSVPREAEALIAHCLKKLPADRYQSGDEILHDIRIMRGNSGDYPLRPLPKSEPSRGLIWLRRYWPLVVSGAAVLVLLIAILSSVSWETPPNPPPKGKGTETTDGQKPKSPTSTAESSFTIIDVNEGRASVYRKGNYLGDTPLRLQLHKDEEVDLVLKCSGFKDKPVKFTATVNQKVITFPMTKK